MAAAGQPEQPSPAGELVVVGLIDTTAALTQHHPRPRPRPLPRLRPYPRDLYHPQQGELGSGSGTGSPGSTAPGSTANISTATGSSSMSGVVISDPNAPGTGAASTVQVSHSSHAQARASTHKRAITRTCTHSHIGTLASQRSHGLSTNPTNFTKPTSDSLCRAGPRRQARWIFWR